MLQGSGVTGPGFRKLGATQPTENLAHWGPVASADRVQVRDSGPFKPSKGISSTLWKRVAGAAAGVLLAGTGPVFAPDFLSVSGASEALRSDPYLRPLP